MDLLLAIVGTVILVGAVGWASERYGVLVVLGGILLLVVSLGGCSTAPRAPASERYIRASWAKISVEQAEAECHHFINTAAGFGSNMYLCMKSKGYDSR